MTAISEAPGWDAIDQALDQLYPGVEPQHLATMLKWRLGGPQPLDGISIYPRDDHWHYVSYGMSELYEKESSFVEQSGWGFEFTIRVARSAGEQEAPMWAANLLQNLGRYVFTSSNAFGPGHYMTLNGPINLDQPDTAIRHVAFYIDPELGEIETPHGRLTFLQVVGMTDAEYEAAQSWSTARLLDAFRSELPLLVTDPARGSLLDNPQIAQIVAEGIARDGSSASSSYVSQLDWSVDVAPTRLVLGALSAPKVATALRGRLPFGRPYVVFSDDRELHFHAGEALNVDAGVEKELHVTVPNELVEPLLAALVDRAGIRAVSSDLTIEIVPTEIKNDNGDVIEVIGGQ